MKKKEDNKDRSWAPPRFCSYACEYASASSNTPSCMTENPIYCTKYGMEVRKTSMCLGLSSGLHARIHIK